MHLLIFFRQCFCSVSQRYAIEISSEFGYAGLIIIDTRDVRAALVPVLEHLGGAFVQLELFTEVVITELTHSLFGLHDRANTSSIVGLGLFLIDPAE